MGADDLAVIVVAYNSDLTRLNTILSSLPVRVYISDNSDNPVVKAGVQSLALSLGACYLDMQGNLGIGAAQNVAAKLAFSCGYSFVLLLDDDSLPAPELVPSLLNAYSNLNSKYIVLTARAVDESGIDISNICDSGQLYTPCSLMNSSGTLISKEAYSAVGEFDESLFVDCVDFEWGWRAIKSGIALYLVSNARINHALGHGKVFGMRYGSPIRHYYQFRNILKLGLSGRAPFVWIVPQLFKLLLKPVVVLFLMDKKCDRLKYMCHGIIDAVLLKSGKYFRD